MLRFINKIISYSGILFKEKPINGDQGILLKAPDSLPSDFTLTLPDNTGSAGQVLSTDGSGSLAWQSVGSGVSSITTPNGGTETGAVALDAHDLRAVDTTGDTMTGVLTMGPIGVSPGQTGVIEFKELAVNGANSVSIRSPDALSSNLTLTLPDNPGTPGQLLSTDGSGITSWVTSSAEPTLFDGSLNGFGDRTQSTLSINDATRTLTISPVSSPYVYYASGTKVTVSTVKTRVWDPIEGLHFFYFNELGQLLSTTTFTSDLILKHALVSVIYWDSANLKHIYWGDERHGLIMTCMTHYYLHTTRGAIFQTGCKLNNFSVDGTGDINANAQFTAGTGIIWDEDIKFDIPSQSNIPIFYRLGATDWRRKNADSFACIYNGTAGYSGTLLAYNRLLSGVWDLHMAQSNKFCLTHIFATNDIEYPYIGILGQNEYNDKASARDGAVQEIKELDGLPVAEFVPVGSIIFQVSNTYDNTPKARVVSTDDGSAYVDYRSIFIRPGSLA